MANPGGTTCTAHANARAGWRCSACGKHLCPGCATEDHLRGTRITRCVHCGGAAETLMVPIDEKPYWTMYPHFLKAIFTGRGVGMLVLVGFFLAGVFFTFYIPFLGPWIYMFFFYGVLASFLFRIIREAASGGEEMPGLSFDGDDGLAEMAMAVMRLLLAAAPVWLPIVIYLHTSFPLSLPMGWTVFLLQEPLAMLSDPVLTGLLIFGLVYIPAAFTVAAMTDSIGDAVNPLVTLGIIFRAPGQYLGVVLIVAAHYFASSYLAEALAKALISQVSGSVFKIIGMLWIVQSATLFLPIMTGFVLGRFIFDNREALGFETTRALMQPALPDARPQAKAPAAPRTAQEQPAMAAAPQAGAPMPQAPAVPARAPAPQAPVEALDLETPPAEVLANALRSGNRTLALGAYRDLAAVGTQPDLDPQTGLALAKLLEQAGDPKAAAQVAYAAANKDLKGPHAPMAIFTAARLLTEKVGSRDGGLKLYKYLVDQFPEHELAGIAREQLK